MSYILNALRKSEQERQQNVADTLENKIQNKQETLTNKSSKGLIALVIFNLLFLLYFAWSFIREEQVDTQEVLVVENKSMSTIKKTLAQENHIDTTMPDIDEQPREQPLSIAEQIANKKSREALTKKQTTNAVIEKIEPIKKPESLLKPKVTIAEAIADNQQGDIPFLSTLDYDFRRKVPSLNINVYVYAEKKQDRFIMIEMKKYSEGQQIISGLFLKEIRMNSLVIEYKKKTFQIKRK